MSREDFHLRNRVLSATFIKPLASVPGELKKANKNSK